MVPGTAAFLIAFQISEQLLHILLSLKIVSFGGGSEGWYQDPNLRPLRCCEAILCLHWTTPPNSNIFHKLILLLYVHSIHSILQSKSIFLFCFLLFEPNPTMLRAYSWLSDQWPLLQGLVDHMGCWGSNQIGHVQGKRLIPCTTVCSSGPQQSLKSLISKLLNVLKLP